MERIGRRESLFDVKVCWKYIDTPLSSLVTTVPLEPRHISIVLEALQSE